MNVTKYSILVVLSSLGLSCGTVASPPPSVDSVRSDLDAVPADSSATPAPSAPIPTDSILEPRAASTTGGLEPATVDVAAAAEQLPVVTGSPAVRWVEQPDGMFIEVDMSSLQPPAEAVLWAIELDGRVIHRSSVPSRPGGVVGVRRDPPADGSHQTVVVLAEDSSGDIVAATAPVEVGS